MDLYNGIEIDYGDKAEYMENYGKEAPMPPEIFGDIDIDIDDEDDSEDDLGGVSVLLKGLEGTDEDTLFFQDDGFDDHGLEDLGNPENPES